LSLLLERYPGKLRLVWKNFPLPQHAQAKLLGAFAAEAQSVGGDKGFWSVHDSLLRSGSRLDEPALIAIAGRAGFDGAGLLSSASSTGHDAGVRADLALGKRLGVNGTPTFFVNGRRLSGALPLAELEGVLGEELKTAEHFVATGTAPGRIYERLCGSAAR
jgi:protein-disulfide isomerase